MPMFTGSVTSGATLIPAPSAYQFIRVLGGEMSAGAAAGEVQLKSGTTVIWDTEALQITPFQVAINVNRQRTIDCAPGQPLNISIGTGTIKVNLEYAVYGLPDPSLLAGS